MKRILGISGLVLMMLAPFLVTQKSIAEEIQVREKVSITEHLHTLKEQMKILDKYPEVERALIRNQADQPDLYPIPGLFVAKSLDLKSKQLADGYTFTPQGVAVSEDYLFISAYSHDHRHNSVIYVLDRTNHRYLKTIVLKKKPHVGGLAYDETHQQLWVCIDGSIGGGLGSISLADIEAYDLEKMQKPIAYQQEVDLPNIHKASLVAKVGTNLVVGYFDKVASGKLTIYPLNSSGQIMPHIDPGAVTAFDEGRAGIFVETNESDEIIKQVQGLTFYQDHILMSQSYGHHTSKVYVFDTKTLANKNFTIEDAKKTLDFPPYLEQITADEKGQLYAIFEGGSAAYRYKTPDTVGDVLTLDIQTLLQN